MKYSIHSLLITDFILRTSQAAGNYSAGEPSPISPRRGESATLRGNDGQSELGQFGHIAPLFVFGVRWLLRQLRRGGAALLDDFVVDE
jgi:hypothetical protein